MENIHSRIKQLKSIHVKVQCELSRTRGARLKGRYYEEVIYMDFDSGH